MSTSNGSAGGATAIAVDARLIVEGGYGGSRVRTVGDGTTIEKDASSGVETHG